MNQLGYEVARGVAIALIVMFVVKQLFDFE